MSGSSFSQLQNVLQLTYSKDLKDQQRAAIDLANLVDGSVFPAVSFGPVAHALCRLVPSTDITVSSHSSRALKLLILDDALRSQASVARVSLVVCEAIKQWEDEVFCLRELLGALQTLCWDRQSVKGVLQADIISHLIDYIQASDQEVAVLSLSIVANILSFSNTLLLQDTYGVVRALEGAMPVLLEITRISQERPQRFYSAAAIANASLHPLLLAALKENGGLEICREIELQSLSNLHILGSKLGDCAQTALYHLSDGVEGSVSLAQNKYSFKWGNKPVMELSLVPASKHTKIILFCIVGWILLLMYTFSPLYFE